MSKHFLVDPTAEIVNKKIPLFTDDLLGDDSRKDISSAMEKEICALALDGGKHGLGASFGKVQSRT